MQGTVFGALAALSVLLNVTALHPLAQLLLAVGTGFQAGRWLARDPERRLPIVRRSAMVLGAVLFVAGVPGILVYRLRQPFLLASLPAAKNGAPNVILLILDTVPTITEVFRAHGYATGAVMGNAGYGGRETGFDRAFIRYDDYPPSIWQALWSATFTQLDVSQAVVDAVRNGNWWRIRTAFGNSSFRIIGLRRGDKNPANTIVDNFMGWRDKVAPRPYFAMLNFIDAHDPYVSPHRTRFNGGRREIDRYDGAISFADSIMGSLLQRLKDRGELDETIIVITSDHGEQFGEHGLRRHGNSLYQELLHVPLLLRAPGRAPADRRVSQVVSLRDIPRTILDLAGLPGAGIPGATLATPWGDASGGPIGGAVAAGNSSGRSALPAAGVSVALAETERPINMTNSWPTAYGPMKAIVGDSLHYIRHGDGEERVFRWRGDTTGVGDETATTRGERVRLESRETLRRLLGPEWMRSSMR